MSPKYTFASVLLILTVSLFGRAQSTFVPLNDDYYHLIDRYEIRSGKLSDSFHSSVKPFQRTAVINLVDSVMADRKIALSDQDFHNFQYLRNDSWEFVKGPTPDSRKQLWNRFYKKPSDFYYSQIDNVDLHVSPVMLTTLGQENNTSSMLWTTARGVEIRGMIANKLGFYTFVTDTQGTFPEYVRDYTDYAAKVKTYAPNTFNIPGETLAKVLRRTGVDFLSARGYITFSALKQKVNFQFGHDRNFYGSGFRSLILSDFATSYLFLKIDTHLGRFRYTNLFCSLINDQVVRFQDEVIPKKMVVIHHLSTNLGKNFNIGVFEAEVLSRTRQQGFEINYLNPIIFYRFVESYLGSADNALLGFDAKWNLKKKISAYGQFILDEFLTKDIVSGRGSWANKYAAQVGVKYIDALGIKNLDLQAEYNVARPYIYSHKDGYTNYVQNNQPLAHPQGANFKELLGIVRYQPTRRLTLYGTLMLSTYGADDQFNRGGNPLISYNLRPGLTVDKKFELGNFIGQGHTVKTTFVDLRLSYMLKHNLFLEARQLFRNADSPTNPLLGSNTTMSSLSVRYNLAYRQQVF